MKKQGLDIATYEVIKDERPMTEAEAIKEANKVYYCSCGSLPSPQLMGTLVCRNCGNYRPDYGREPMQTQDPEPA